MGSVMDLLKFFVISLRLSLFTNNVKRGNLEKNNKLP